MILYHWSHDVNVERNAYFSAVQLVEVSHGLWFTVCSHNNFDVFGENFRQPERNIALFSIVSIDKVVYSLKNEYNFVIEYV